MPEKFEHMTQEHFRAGILWIAKMSQKDKWNLTDEEAANLLGDIDVNTYQNMKYNAENGIPFAMNSTSYECLSLLLNIWKCLRLFVPESPENLAYNWFNTPNTVGFMKDKSIKNYLLERKDIDAFYRVKNYLSSQC